ncbi:MAG: hypothetical protein ABSG78_11045 [Verrucomicrobiota bacterium]|jgi:hypothetical protein
MKTDIIDPFIPIKKNHLLYRLPFGVRRLAAAFGKRGCRPAGALQALSILPAMILPGIS